MQSTSNFDNKNDVKRIMNHDFKINLHNQPILKSIYKKQGSLDEVVILLVPIYSGARNIKFSVSENGLVATIKYDWPSALYNMVKLFEHDIKNGSLFLENPKIIAIEEDLSNYRSTTNEIPSFKIEVILPCQVETNPNSHFVKGYLDNDGTRIVRIELPVMKKEYSRNEKVISF